MRKQRGIVDEEARSRDFLSLRAGPTVFSGTVFWFSCWLLFRLLGPDATSHRGINKIRTTNACLAFAIQLLCNAYPPLRFWRQSLPRPDSCFWTGTSKPLRSIAMSLCYGLVVWTIPDYLSCGLRLWRGYGSREDLDLVTISCLVHYFVVLLIIYGVQNCTGPKLVDDIWKLIAQRRRASSVSVIGVRFICALSSGLAWWVVMRQPSLFIKIYMPAMLSR